MANYNVSSNPHDRDSITTTEIMLNVIIALFPATLFGVYNFGVRAAIIIAVTVASCILTEYLYEKGMKKKITIGDCSALLTGLLLALNLPSTIPYWMAAMGGIFAILVVKQVFGGLGQNFMNPALGARCFLLVSFAKHMTDFTYDGVSGATPLAIIKKGGDFDLMKMFLGSTAGTIGETSALCIILGGLYLAVRKLIDIRIPLFYIGSFVVFILIFHGKGFDYEYLAKQLCGGGLMLGAFFMATDYVTSPITKNGRIVFGIILGFLTAVLRAYGAGAEGVSYAIIISNILVPLIEKVTQPTAFGWEGKK